MKLRTLYIFTAMILSSAALAAEPVSVPVSWESVPSAEEYTVEIMDEEGRIIRNVQTFNTRYIFRLEPGTYRVRITGINKFRKQEGQSVWTQVSVKRIEKGLEKTVNPYEDSLYIGAAYTPMKVLGGTQWKYMYGFSLIGASVYLGMDLGFFSRLQKVPLVRNMGLEYQLSFLLHTKGKFPQKNIADATMRQIGNGVGLYFKFSFGLPICLILRAQSGLVMTNFKTQINNVDNSTATSDIFYRGGLSIRWPIGMFFMEAGGNYESILYADETFSGVTTFFAAGIRF